ncbi:MAG: metal ABC transporter substrate-binding protein [Nitrosopumilus sp.]|nr:zinc ABC transporter substrate-binding protein [Nitrosopumilus sp.]MDC4229988.1 metal ABC transporter substrate-binding protein [Nitrosopumilus sp.]
MNIQIKLAIIAIAIVIPLTSFAVTQPNFTSEISTTDNSKLQVVTSATFLYEFTQNIGKEMVDVTLLVPMGADPHDWEPTIRDTERLQRSDVIIVNGIGYEHWIGSLELTGIAGILVDTSNGISTLDSAKHDEEKHDEEKHDEEKHDEEKHDEEKHDEEKHDEEKHDEEKHGALDPHIWLNPVYAQLQVKNIANALSNSDPMNKNHYQSNAEIYNQELNLLDAKIRTELSGCKTDFITFHDAFSYFSEEYGLTQHTIISSTDSHGEVTLKTLENIVSLARELNIKIIFAEESASTKTSQVIADEIGGKVLVLSPLEIVSDETYVEKMTQNLESLKEALC